VQGVKPAQSVGTHRSEAVPVGRRCKIFSQDSPEVILNGGQSLRKGAMVCLIRYGSGTLTYEPVG